MFTRTVLLLIVAATTMDVGAAAPPAYETRARHDPNGIGKFYLGREIAHVMGPGGIPWLERPEREDEEQPGKVIAAMQLKGSEVVVDLGAGSGYYTFRIAPLLSRGGKVIAVELQDEMITALSARTREERAANVDIVRGTARDPRLPAGSVDVVLMVDVYHELEFPYEVMWSVVAALKPDGRVALVEYRGEDPAVPIKEVHKMTAAQVRREMAAVGLVQMRAVSSLPWQHILIFGRAPDR